ncbi:hypothetical protein AVEN_218748-1 [Araneus ventricosus]|uniref:Uncharacterized protein n=1 Tax=Araneus ventricosus TaxID=182803 RepID=A0A4Y2B4X7_ARAVE|nr:hypothetical protein AVEN_218748-1 [Araneus ventricosus]
MQANNINTEQTKLSALRKVFDIIDGTPAAPGDDGGDIVYIWMLPSALYLLALSNVTPALSPRTSPQSAVDPVIGLKNWRKPKCIGCKWSKDRAISKNSKH